MPEQEKEELPNIVFGTMDLMPLVELCNEIYETIRQRPSMHVPATEKWMRKFSEFVASHQMTKIPESAIIKDSSEYKALERTAIARDIQTRMKDGV